MSGNSHTDKNGDVADVSVSPVEIIAVDEMEETKLAATRQKLIKAGLLAVLAVIVIYVVLDYTVSIYIYMLASYAHSQNGLRSAAAAAAAAAAALTRLS